MCILEIFFQILDILEGLKYIQAKCDMKVELYNDQKNQISNKWQLRRLNGQIFWLENDFNAWKILKKIKTVACLFNTLEYS